MFTFNIILCYQIIMLCCWFHNGKIWAGKFPAFCGVIFPFIYLQLQLTVGRQLVFPETHFNSPLPQPLNKLFTLRSCLLLRPMSSVCWLGHLCLCRRKQVSRQSLFESRDPQHTWPYGIWNESLTVKVTLQLQKSLQLYTFQHFLATNTEDEALDPACCCCICLCIGMGGMEECK